MVADQVGAVLDPHSVAFRCSDTDFLNILEFLFCHHYHSDIPKEENAFLFG